MNFNKILRILVCLVLVCCMIVDVSPVKAEAFAGELVMTGVAAAGAIGLLYLAMAGGAVYVPQGLGTFEAVGTAFTEYMYQWGSTAEKLEECEEFFGGLSLVGNDPDDDGDDEHDRTTKILDGIRRGAALFTAAAILAECAIVEKKEVPVATGWTLYSDTLLPTVPSVDGLNYHALVLNSKTSYYQMFYADQPFCIDGSGWLTAMTTTNFCYAEIPVSKVNSWNSLSDKWSLTDVSSINNGSYLSTQRTLLWTNFDLVYKKDYVTVAMYGSDPCTSFVQEESVEPNSFVTAVKDQLSSGELSANDLVIPDINYANLVGSDGSVLTGIQDILRRLDEGIITHEEFIEIVTVPVPVPDPVPDPSEDPSEPTSPEIIAPSTPDIDTDVGDETLANTNAATFLDNLANVITTPFKWIWGKIETTFTRLLDPEIWLDPLPEIALQPAKWLWEKIETSFTPLLDPETRRAPFEWIWGKIEPIPGQIIEAVTDAVTEVKEAVQSLIVPDKDYLSDKVAALCSEFAFADAIVRTAKALQLGLANITTEPPVIYIDLGATRGDYNLGGKVPFLDLRWYAEYKPTVDILLSAFLWICFVWRMFIKLPGIISGMPGDFNAYTAIDLGLTSYLPHRSIMLERARESHKEKIRKKE